MKVHVALCRRQCLQCWMCFAFSVDVISADIQRCRLPLVVQSQEETPHCLYDLQISSSGIGGGVTPGESMHSQDGATLLTQILYCQIDIENSAIPCLHVQVTFKHQ